MLYSLSTFFVWQVFANVTKQYGHLNYHLLELLVKVNEQLKNIGDGQTDGLLPFRVPYLTHTLRRRLYLGTPNELFLLNCHKLSIIKTNVSKVRICVWRQTMKRIPQVWLLSFCEKVRHKKIIFFLIKVYSVDVTHPTTRFKSEYIWTFAGGALRTFGWWTLSLYQTKKVPCQGTVNVSLFLSVSSSLE